MSANHTATIRTLVPHGGPSIDAYAESLFGHLPRSDQRRWARVYLEGLLTTSGKKSVRRLAAAVTESSTASQSLQQFINVSPWEWDPARTELARWTEHHRPVQAWILGITILPKRGDRSVGVHRRFIPHSGRMVNCQVAMGLFLLTESASVPVDWQLFLPDQWAEDARLRKLAHLPDAVQGRPLWSHVLDLVDSQVARTTQPHVPVVADFSGCPDIHRLATELTRRGRDFVMAVPPSALVRPSGPLGQQNRGLVTAREYLGSHQAQRPRTVIAALPDGRQRHVRVVSGLVQMPSPAGGASARHRMYRLFTQWRPEGERPARLWLSNITDGSIGELLSLAALECAAGPTRDSLVSRFGLLDFEGRSFPGWHHHVTLVSAAHAYHTLFGPDAGLPETVGGTA
ncbi:IS701 family transposase [Streptomyces achromogenes]|uniref:IS701 family transposase n=1 Tax=Streptomyces achromogenes TaxID=67255 RepID=UPI003A7F8B05